MRTMRSCRLPVVLSLIASLAASGRWACGADTIVGVPTEPNHVVRDVRLGPEGVLRVRVVDVNGRPVQEESVTLRCNGSPVAAEMTDKDGTLSVGGLKGGVYGIEVDGQLQMCRVWPASMAPPAAIDSAFLVVESPVVRGQRPIGSLVNRRALVIGALVVAAVAIPVAISNDDDDSGS